MKVCPVCNLQMNPASRGVLLKLINRVAVRIQAPAFALLAVENALDDDTAARAQVNYCSRCRMIVERDF